MSILTEVPNLGDWIDKAPLRERSVSFLVVGQHGAVQAYDMVGKRQLIWLEPGPLFVLWTGKYRTDVRKASADERAVIAHVFP